MITGTQFEDLKLIEEFDPVWQADRTEEDYQEFERWVLTWFGPELWNLYCIPRVLFAL